MVDVRRKKESLRYPDNNFDMARSSSYDVLDHPDVLQSKQTFVSLSLGRCSGFLFILVGHFGTVFKGTGFSFGEKSGERGGRC